MILKCMVVNSKGGVGKSLLSRELIASHLDNTTLYEFDAANLSQKPFDGNVDFKIKCFSDEKIDQIIVEDLMDDTKSIVFDIGVEHVTQTLENFIENGLDEFIDMFFIPVRPNCEDSAKNAIKTAKFLKYKSPETKICFIFNGIADHQSDLNQFSYFTQKCVEHDIDTSISISFPTSKLFAKAHALKSTIKKLSESTNDYRQLSIKERANGNNTKAIEYIRKDLAIRAMKSFYKSDLASSINQLENAINA